MISIIKCTTCNAEMGTIEKEKVNQADVDLYLRMVTCPNGHIMSTELQETPQE